MRRLHAQACCLIFQMPIVNSATPCRMKKDQLIVPYPFAMRPIGFGTLKLTTLEANDSRKLTT